jgi:S-formylglutathione hydrolase FrmB
MSRLLTGLVTAALALTLVDGGPARALPTPDSPGCVVAPAPHLGLREVTSKRVDARMSDLTLRSVAMADDQHVNVLLPTGYDPTGRTRYPVLYLLHGAFGSYQDWATHGVEQLIGGLPMIVVMPDDGMDGSYSDWYGTVAGSTDHPPAWESYHVQELIGFVDRHYPTRPERAGRFVAGLSSGGAGAAKYAAAHPGLFGAVGSFSGAVNTDIDYPQYPLISEGLWGITSLPGQGPDGHCTWGDPVTEHLTWLDNDPTYLAQAFAGTPLFLAAGDGNPGALDPSGPGFDPTEYEVHAMTLQLIKALDSAGIAHTDELYGAGTHTWPYWQREFRHFLRWLTPLLDHPAPPPAAFSMRSARSRFTGWGWTFTPHRDVREFSYLTDVSAGGLGVTGSGGLDVITAALYQPGQAYDLTVAGGPRRLIAGADQRLRFTLDLGPSHQTQQHQFGSNATRTWTHLQVRIAAVTP